jgi:hypothetical protein
MAQEAEGGDYRCVIQSDYDLNNAPANLLGAFVVGASRCHVRFWPKADTRSATAAAAFGGKADMIDANETSKCSTKKQPSLTLAGRNSN